MSKLGEALRKKFRSPQEALRHIGLDETLLDDQEQEKMANQFNQEAYRRAYLAAIDASKKMLALDKRYGRDEESEPSSIEERLRRLEELFEQLTSADALHRFGGGRDSDLYDDLGEQSENGWQAGDRRRGARDMPPYFEGRPEGGAADPAVMRQQRDWDRKAEDRRRRGLGADSMYGLGPRPTSALESKSFHAMFPQAKRIGYLG